MQGLHHRLALASLLAVLAFLPVTAGVAAASPGPSAVAKAQSETQRKVNALLRYNPGSRQLDATSVAVADGVVVTVSTTASADTFDRAEAVGAAAVPVVCAAGWVCMWQHTYFHGDRISFASCSRKDLSNYRMSNGSTWSDQISSFFNAQAFSTAVFYNWTGRWDLIMFADPGEARPDLDLAFTNDKIDMVDPC
jgi:hypothetical protein